jgi:hypothetical protein
MLATHFSIHDHIYTHLDCRPGDSIQLYDLYYRQHEVLWEFSLEYDVSAREYGIAIQVYILNTEKAEPYLPPVAVGDSIYDWQSKYFYLLCHSDNLYRAYVRFHPEQGEASVLREIYDTYSSTLEAGRGRYRTLQSIPIETLAALLCTCMMSRSLET